MPTCLITGASSGLGAALARHYASAGYSLGLIARRGELLQELAEELRASANMVAVQSADVSDRPQLLAAVQTIREEIGPIELMIANAGVGKPDFLEPFSVEQIDQMIQVNLLGVINTIAAVLPEMLERRQGHLVAISSSGAFKGMPGSAGYCASKAGLNTFLEGLRIQLREHRIPVTTICPGFIETEMTRENAFYMPGLMTPAVAATHIVNAIRRRKKVAIFPWKIALLMKTLPWLPDWIIARMIPRKTDGKVVHEK